jgi:hypothetical protein
VGRLKQIFIAPGSEEAALPIPPSAWHSGRMVLLPIEHWERILDFAAQMDADATRTLQRYAYPPDGKILPPKRELQQTLSFIHVLIQALPRVNPLVPEANALFPENFPNTEHVLMLQAVQAVLQEAYRLEQPFEGDVS